MRSTAKHLALMGLLGCGKEHPAPDTAPAASGADSAMSSDSGTSSGDSGTDTAAPTDPYIDGRDCPEDVVATWTNFGQGFLLTHCVGCHSSLLGEGERGGAPMGADFETQEQVQAWLGPIYSRSGDDNTTMPPVDSIASEDRYVLGDWLACGAP